MPNTGFLLVIRAMFTVNSPFLLKNSFVPSKGSINQNVFLFLKSIILDSSEMIGILGKSFLISRHIILLAAISALVTGDLSFFIFLVILVL